MADNELKDRTGLAGIVANVQAGLQKKFPKSFAAEQGVSEPESPPGGDEDMDEGYEPESEPEFYDRDEDGEEPGRSGDLNEALRQERERRRAAERKIQHLNQDLAHAKARSSRGETIEAILSQKRPEDFDSWEADKQAAWISAEAAKAELRANLGDSAFEDLRQVLLETKVLKALPNLRGRQVEAVARVMELSNGMLSPKAAWGAAAAEHPELFATRSDGGAGSPPGLPRVQEPGRSGRRRSPPDKRNQLQQQMQDGPTVRSRHMAAAALISQALKGKR